VLSVLDALLFTAPAAVLRKFAPSSGRCGTMVNKMDHLSAKWAHDPVRAALEKKAAAEAKQANREKAAEQMSELLKKRLASKQYEGGVSAREAASLPQSSAAASDDAEYRRQLDIQRERLLNPEESSDGSESSVFDPFAGRSLKKARKAEKKAKEKKEKKAKKEKKHKKEKRKKRGSSDDDDSDDARKRKKERKKERKRERDDGSDSDSSDSERERRRREKKRKRKERESGGDDATAAPVQVVYAGSSVNPYG